MHDIQRPPPGVHSQRAVTVDLGKLGKLGKHILIGPTVNRASRLAMLHAEVVADMDEARAQLAEADAAHGGEDGEKAPDYPERGSLVSTLAAQSERYMATLGALIGACWCHPSLALDVGPMRAGGDLLAYGEAVYEELSIADYPMAAIRELARRSFEITVERLAPAASPAAVEAHKDFS